MKRLTVSLLLTLFCLCPLTWAQTNLDDELFGGNPVTEKPAETTTGQSSSDAPAGDGLFGDSFISDKTASQEDASNSLLEQDKISIGGSLSFYLGANALLSSRNNDWKGSFNSNAASVNGRLYLDARPSRDMRFLIKTNLGYSSASGSNFDLHEAFIDTDVNKQLFIRAGKQTINWGVGSILRTANLMNLQGFDRDKPNQELAGPVAIKLQYPLGVNNLTGYGFTVSRNGENALGLAVLYEYLVGGYELTSGARYVLGDNPWAMMTTARGAIRTPIGSISLSAEAVLEGNIDKRFVIPDGKGGITTATSEALFFSGEIGASYNNSKNENFPYYLSAAYAFNGKGYDDSSILRNNAAAIPALIGAKKLSFSEISHTGQHYMSFGLSVLDIAKSKVGVSSNWFGNLSDGSGSLGINLSYSDRKYLSDYVSPRLSYSYNYGANGTEFGNSAGHQLRLQVSVSLGGGF